MPKRTSTTPMGYVDVVITGDSSAVQTMMTRVEVALSATGLVHFMSTMVHPWLQKRASDRFASEGDDVSGSWLPLSQFTQNNRASKGYGAAHPINHRTGRMERYITQTGVDFRSISASGVSIKFPGGSPPADVRDKIRTAQVGDPTFPSTPPRPVLGMNEKDLEAVLVGLAMHLESYP